MTADDTPSRIYLCHNRNGHPRFEEVGPDDIGAEAWVKEGAGVRVKALEWRDGWASDDLFNVAVYYKDAKERGYFENERAARILAALEPVAQPEQAEAALTKIARLGQEWDAAPSQTEYRPDLWAESMGLDAAKWAAEFRNIALRLGYSDMDEGWLIGWFANAIEYARRDRLPADEGLAARLAAMRETFCYASPGWDAEFTSLLLGFDTAAKVIQEYTTEPTPGQFETMCLAIEDVVTGRGFDVDPWQPIETAPKDGTPFQCWCEETNDSDGARKEYWVPEARINDGCFEIRHSHGWFDANMLSWVKRVPVRWTPLPKPPGETTSAIPEAVKAYLRNALMVGGWRGER